MDSDKKYFLISPPTDQSFHELLRFMWSRGVGNTFNSQGDPTPWTDTSLEAAMDNLDYSIDRRSLQNWHSGKNIPQRKNIYALGRVAGADDEQKIREWQDAFIAGRDLKDIPKTSSKDEQPREFVIREKQTKASSWIWLLAIVLALSIVLIFLLFNRSPAFPHARNINFCDEAHFSQEELLCKKSLKKFPHDIKLIYVSFELVGVEYKQKFERKWYRNGEHFKSFETYNDEAWRGYTYLGNPETHDPGDYVLRVIIGEEVTTGMFTVEAKEK